MRFLGDTLDGRKLVAVKSNFAPSLSHFCDGSLQELAQFPPKKQAKVTHIEVILAVKSLRGSATGLTKHCPISAGSTD